MKLTRLHTKSVFGEEKVSATIIRAFADVKHSLMDVSKRVRIPKETSGAVVQRLGVTALRIGRQIDPGVPWTFSLEEPRLALALKSGNFGGADFFAKALGMVQ